VYSPKSGQQTFVFHSEEYAVHRHFNSAIWMLPIVKPKGNKSQKEVGANLIDNFSFSEFVAFSTLPEGPAFISKMLTQQECAKVDQRYTGVYSKVLSCLVQRQYSLDQIAHETGLPISTLSKFRMGNISIMEFVRSYRRERIREMLKHSDDPHSVAREEGFSSKYKMLDFLNRDNANKSSVVE
jgi:AraC-like DNA-binding protein